MQLINKRTNVFILVMTLACMVLFASQVEAKDYKVEDRTITIPQGDVDTDKVVENADLIIPLSQTDVYLEGLNDQMDFYFNVPAVGAEKSSLNLNLSYSDLLTKDSTVTIAIDDKRVKSERIDTDENEMKLTISLPKEARSPGTHHLSIIFDGHLSDEMCVNEESPANWLTIRGNSHLLLTGSDPQGDLADYPYPFIQNNNDEPVQGTIVIPNDPSAEIMQAALEVATHLQNELTDATYIPIVYEDDLTKIHTNMIAIGAEDDWSSTVKDLFTAGEPAVKEGHLTVSNYALKLPSTTKQLLFVTGESGEVIKDHISLLTTESSIEQLANNEVVIDKLPVKEDENPGHYSFKQMQIPNVELNGEKKQSEQYFFKLPAQTDYDAGATVHVKIKASEPLRKMENGEVTLYVNGVPHSIDAADLEKSTDEAFTYVSIPVDPGTLKAQPTLSIQWQASGLEPEEICAPVTSGKWAYIDEESSLELSLSDEAVEPNFNLWPNPFGLQTEDGASTLVILPESSEDVMKELQALFTSFTYAHEQTDLRLVQASEVEEADLKENHIILLGHLKDHETIQGMMDEPFLEMKDDGRYDLSAYDIVSETADYIAWTQASIWNDDLSLAHFATMEPETDRFMSASLATYLTEQNLDATVIVENKNGEFFSNEVDQAEVGKTKSKQTSTPFSKEESQWLMIGFIAILLIGILIYIYVYRSTKRNK